MFCGEDTSKAKEIWLVDAAPVVIEKFETAVKELEQFMASCGLENRAEDVANLKGDLARAEFINYFKEVQRYKTQLEQYTDLDEADKAKIEAVMPEEELRPFKIAYLETAKRLKEQQDKDGDNLPEDLQQLDFEFVLFASAVVDYDYIMGLIAKYTDTKPSKQKMTQEQLINLLSASANLMDDKEDIAEYIKSLTVGKPLSEKEIREGFENFREEKAAKELAVIANKHGIAVKPLKTMVDGVVERMIFDGDALSDLLAPLELGWKDRAKKETALMEDLIPQLKKLAQGGEIAGLSAYE
ncbi:type I restriction endonuclease subunit R, EcoR124 family [Pedobacter glucosidilyticus]|uniref:type I restriction endonuclease subunit R, EcoR124 family n=1 Tax=Pedobacter glucosidilyticus TaxID=1122941 RepID=UPI0024807B69|nr:hypothetical protein [Pedobacter glucosidilyticus]